jgi:hypothetical protein
MCVTTDEALRHRILPSDHLPIMPHPFPPLPPAPPLPTLLLPTLLLPTLLLPPLLQAPPPPREQRSKTLKY